MTVSITLNALQKLIFKLINFYRKQKPVVPLMGMKYHEMKNSC